MATAGARHQPVSRLPTASNLLVHRQQVCQAAGAALSTGPSTAAPAATHAAVGEAAFWRTTAQSAHDPRLAEAVAAAALHEILRLEADAVAAAQTVSHSLSSALTRPSLVYVPGIASRILSLACPCAGLYCVQAQLADNLIACLFGRNADQEKARKAKQAQQQKVEEALGPLLGWLQGGYVGFTLLPAEVRQLAEQAGLGEGWTAGKQPRQPHLAIPCSA